MNRPNLKGSTVAKGGLVLALSMAVFLGMVGVAVGQLSQTVTASFNSDYTPATCLLTVANSGNPGVQATSVDLTSPNTLYVENIGNPDSNGNPSNMAVYVAFQDNGGAAETAGSAGWYQGSTWVPSANLSTTWLSNQYTPTTFPLEGNTGNTQGPAYSDVASNAGYMPITFTATPISNLPAGAYNQQIVFTGTC